MNDEPYDAFLRMARDGLISSEDMRMMFERWIPPLSPKPPTPPRPATPASLPTPGRFNNLDWEN